MNDVFFRALQITLTLAVSIICQNQMVHAELAIEDFFTESGECLLTEKSELIEKSDSEPSYSYTLDTVKIFRNRGFSKDTGTNIPPLTRVNCLAKSAGGGKTLMLVTAAKETLPYCGWVETKSLLEANSEDSFGLGSGLSPCGAVTAVSIKEFCARVKEIYGVIEGCSQKFVARSVIKTKFITDNTTNINQDNMAEKDTVILYSSAQAKEDIGTVDIFTILEVFDQAINTETGDLMLLVGINGENLKGWINYKSGTIWYSNLSTYFSKNGTHSVYQAEIGVRDNKVLAKRPENLEQTLASNKEFPRFPVLFDRRLRTKATPAKIKPNLQVAFIGRYCGTEAANLCSGANDANQNHTNLNSADIMFLIDGTNSMKKYFGLVAEVVEGFTTDYIDDPDYRFGVAMYGDFKDKSNVETQDAIDFKVVHKLQLNFGELFKGLGDTKLFLKDVMKDKEDATNAAIYNAVKKSNWKKERLKFLIHIGDHGDRKNPSKLTLTTMKSQNIFYIPVAVKGEKKIQANETFVKQANLIFENYRTDSNSPMALPPIVTYQNNVDEREAIAQALVISLITGKEAEGNRRSDILGDRNDLDLGPNTLPPGFAQLTLTAKELFLPDSTTEEFKNIAAKGFIETVEIGDLEPNWDYFVTLDAPELLSLNRNMETVCLSIGSSKDRKIISQSIVKMIEALTGDKLTQEDLAEYWTDRGSIPLVTQTFLGHGMKQFLADHTNTDRLIKYKKGFCRGHELTTLMLDKKKLPKPYEGQSLKWTGDYYESEGAVEHQWLYKDLFDRGYYYLPLTYLPGWKRAGP